MIHGFFVEDGKVRYRNRYVRTPKWELEHGAGQALFGTFGNPMTTDPSAMGKDSGVANTNIVWHAGKLLALEEGHQPFELDPVTLESRGYRDEYRGKVTAHPKIDPETGEMVWFAYSAGDMPLNGDMRLRRHRQDRRGRAPRRVRGAVRGHGPRLPGHQPPRPVPDPAADHEPAAGDDRRAADRLGAGQGLARRA